MILERVKVEKNDKSLILKSEGFTLIESLVSIAIFTLGTSFAIFSINYSLALAPKIEDRVIAAYLAQEGIEIVKNIRDINYVNNDAFNVGLAEGAGCVQYDSNLFDAGCALSGGSDVVLFDGTYYSHDVGVATSFRRNMIITEVVPGVHIRVESQVICGNGCDVILEGHLYDWK